ncbi:MAG: restriction endonuclease, SacI family [Chloroflexi bacterium]|nr:restriction endonuclease, SacI family [Chloroflexota bacterium]
MPQTPIEIMESAYENAKGKSIKTLLTSLPSECAEDLKIIVENAETQKAVLGVTLTSLVYKVYKPSQDIRKHQDRMEGGYSGRTFDTKFVTPFLKEKFPHFAMAESAWLTRSLEQPHPFNLDFPGKIRNTSLKSAFLNTLNYVEGNGKLASTFLVALMALMLESSANDDVLFTDIQVTSGLTIAKIIEAVSQHIRYDYGAGVVGTARIPVLAIYSVYNLLMPDVKRYSDKTLAPLESHTSPDSRSKSLGDIDVNSVDGSCFESIEIKHNKPISADMVGVAYRKIKNTGVDRYYILTTNEPNFDDQESVMQEIEKYKRVHSCQIIVNGVIPSLKYYMRLLSNPQNFVDEYTKWLKYEFQRASGIKREHLRVWQEICQTVLKIQ